MPHEPKVGELPALLPCPFCGNGEVQIVEGRTFRWRFACCTECGAQSPEARVQTIGDGTPEEWEAAGRRDALKEWNTRAEREARKDEARDAARYRWLRTNANEEVSIYEGVSRQWFLRDEELDAAIDALQADQPESP